MKKIIYRILTSALIRAMINPRYGKVDKVPGGKIFISTCRRNRLGDFIMNNHAIGQLEKVYRLTHCCTTSFFHQHREYFENHCLVTDYFLMPDLRWKRLLSIFRLRRRKIDAVLIDYQPVISPVYFYLAGIPVICTVRDTSFFSTHSYDFERFGTHYGHLGRCISDLLGAPDPGKDTSPAPYFRYRKEQAGQWKDSKGITLSVHIGGATYWMRRWPQERYLEICAAFLKTYEGTLLLLGGREETAENEKFRAALLRQCGGDRVRNCCGCNLNTTANILASSDLFLGNDSGPMHMATALNTRVVAIFGPSAIGDLTPVEYNGRNVVIQSGLDCVPCGSRTCRLPADRQFTCLTGLSTEMVWTRLQQVLDNVCREKGLVSRRTIPLS